MREGDVMSEALYLSGEHALARFPALQPASINDLNRVLRAPLTVTLSPSLTLQVSGIAPVAGPDDRVLSWQWGKGRLETRFPLDWLMLLQGEAPLQVTVDDDVACLWARLVLEPWREQLAAETGQAVEFTSQPGEIVLRLALTIQDGERRLGGGSLGLDVQACRQWLATVPEASEDGLRARWPQLILPLAMVAGRQSLPYRTLARLRPGNVVMLTRPSRGIEAVYAGQPLACAGVDQSHWVCRQRIAPYGSLSRQENVDMIPDQTGSPETALDALTLTLECWLGEVRLTLAELQRLTPGTVLGVAPVRQECVELRINGQRIGSGELVELGEGLGVRITRLAAS
ncbi:hypothetical protein ES964_26980 (plasmid) [Klebsiella pneumoniae]|nr:hypothetical protein ES964_26980 [Klebsiella pneumoniae]